MAAGYGQASTGSWPAVALGAVLLLIAAGYLIAALRRARRRRGGVSAPAAAVGRSAESSPAAGVPLVRCCGLIAEAMIVRERMSGQIDALTYQAHMSELAREAAGERDRHHNAH